MFHSPHILKQQRRRSVDDADNRTKSVLTRPLRVNWLLKSLLPLNALLLAAPHSTTISRISHASILLSAGRVALMPHSSSNSKQIRIRETRSTRLWRM